ncbi:glycosyltransferase family 39 protein [Rhizobium sp. NTR19]|uniref:Glycosyltransferase family 39 protein n=1 Tax=Neorhizobium turbinariae TaxID=2937795 RepID=A0ABT0IV40_9HYPH|nr:glycosyltransferase family 39 protein [Neorhizobium turbinariae]MCK8781732.1 glycosyltransferase family 39 protein [Neorhizobium turbinariae]
MRAILSIREALARRPTIVLWLIAGYYLLAIVLRVLRSDALESDEAEQLIQSQFLLMGYGRQPPFYNWLQYGVIQLIGPSILALSLVKNLLLFLTCVFYGLAARLVLKDMRLVAIAMLGVVAMPVVSVVAQRDLTHAVATLFSVAVFTYAFLLAIQRPNLGTYLFAGVAVGMGLISKYNFVLVPLAAVLAVLAERDLRNRVLDWRLGAAVAVAALICLPHLFWVLGNLNEATSGTIAAMREDASGDAVNDRITGLLAMLGALAGGGLPVLGFFLIAFRTALPKAWRATSPWTRIIGRTILICLILVALVALGFGASNISEKWLSPFLLLVPLYLCLKIEAAGADATASVERFVLPVSVLALGGIIYLAIGVVIGPMFGKYAKENWPSTPFIHEVIERHGGDMPAYVIATDPYLAGSARTEIPEAKVIFTGFKQVQTITEDELRGGGLVVWPLDGDATQTPAYLGPFLQQYGIKPEVLVPSTLAVPYRYSWRDDRVGFGYAWVTAAASGR